MIADAHTTDGRLGTGGGEVVSRIPLQIEPKLPLEVTEGDRIDLPVAVSNATNQQVPVDITLGTDSSLRMIGDAKRSLSLAADQRTRTYFGLDVVRGNSEQESMIELGAISDAGTLADAVRRPIKIVPSGYPIRESYSGVVTGRTPVSLTIPEDAVDGSLSVSLRAFPSPLADVMEGVESILREPHGCFEQTSATNYPNAMALQYLQRAKLDNPQVARRAKTLLDKGYKKLTSFECQKLGYEWFGSDPGHEALSAFGLMQFTDMANVMEVDAEMIVRTRGWLLDRRDGKGSFKRNPRHLHVWSVDQKMVDAYVLWAITEADVAAGNRQRGASELKLEVDRLHQVATESEDPYFIALSAATLMNVHRERAGEALLRKLEKLQDASGMLDGKTTVTQSGGLSRKVETTAIAILAWSKSPRFRDPAAAAAKWLIQNRTGSGGFGSTQATVLALKALLAIAGGTSDGEPGRLSVIHDGQEIASVELPRSSQNGTTVEITNLGDKLGTGDVSVELVALGMKTLPFAFDIGYHAVTPPTDGECPLELETQLLGDSLVEGKIPSGSTLQVEAVVRNASNKGLPMTIATVGLPGGIEPRVEHLNELKDEGEFDYYELRGREVVFYWRTVEPKQSINITFDVIAQIPGKYTGPASRAYLYYTAEQKYWTRPLEIEIAR